MKYTIIAVLFAGILAGTTLLAAAATLNKVGVNTAEHPQGIQLRQDSVRAGHRGGFFLYYGRTHAGGGLRGGK
ncbi:MAG: hypothetical protein ACLFOY_12085 [Desulfatibacillaceae bacterium]